MQSAIRDPRSSIGPYRIVKILGRGGMGVVYLGEHGQTGDSVAIKTVFSAREATLASIRREIHALGRVRHPGVVRIVDQGVSAGLPWYAMELIRGQTLRDYIRQLWDPSMNRTTSGVGSTRLRTTSGVGSTRLRTTSGVGSTQLNERDLPTVPLHGDAAAAATSPRPASEAVEARSLAETLTLMRSLCAPLSFLHGCGIVHRDIKPENVFIRTDGTLVLVDLGIATRFGGAEGREELVAGGEIVGSCAYMAPEQIRGELVDARADLYALGCVLYEALTGRPPFSGADARSILEEHLLKPPMPPSHHVRGIPEALDRLTLRLLEKRARDRLGYADDVASTLGALGAERRTGEVPKSRTYLYQPPLTGRDEALRRLTVALRGLEAQRRGGKIFIAGASGVGKTRLAMEIARAAVQRGIDVLTGQCVALGAADGTGDASAKAAPLHPLRPMLLAVADRCRQGGAQETARILGPRGKVLELHEPALAELPGQQVQPEPAPLPAPAARARLLACLKDTLFSLAEAAPVLIVLDDLQWIDELSLCLLGELSPAELEERGVLLVGVYRMEEVSAELAATARAPGVVRIELGRLDAVSVEQMVRDMLGLRQPARALIEFLDRHCDGNPFFIAEYLRAAIDEGMVTRDDAGQWSIEERRDRADVIETALPQPRSLAALIERRLLGLGSEPLQIAQLASVLGREFDGQLLMATAGIDERTAMDAIEVLRVRQILEESVDGRLRFVHDKLRETAYERMPEERRRELHGSAAAAIEERQPDAPDALPILAHHFAHARIHHKASAYYARAGRRARAAHATGDAITSYRAAIDEAEACRGQDAPPLGELREGLGDVLVLAGRQEEARAVYGDALATAPDGEPVRRASLLRKIGKTWETHHDHENALRTYATAEAVLGDAPRAGASGDEEAAWWHEWVQIQNDRVYVHYWLAQVDEMTALVAKVRPIVEERGSPSQRAHFYDDLVHLNLRRESYLASAETVQYARMARDAAVQSGDVSKAAYAWFMLAFSLLFHGDLVAAQEEMLGALGEAERTSDVPLQARCLTYLTMIHRRRGRAHETRQVGTRSLAVAVGSRMLDYVGAARANLAWAALREGDTETAERESQTAIRIWSQLSASYPYPMQWIGLWVRVALELAAGRLPGAAAAARAMLDPKQERFPRPLEEILEQSTDAYDRGDEDAARHHLERAIALSRDLGYS